MLKLQKSNERKIAQEIIQTEYHNKKLIKAELIKKAGYGSWLRYEFKYSKLLRFGPPTVLFGYLFDCVLESLTDFSFIKLITGRSPVSLDEEEHQSEDVDLD